MTLKARDAAATLPTALAVLAYTAVRQGWGVPLVGDSRRWAAAAIVLLGMASCSLGRHQAGGPTMIALSLLGVAALLFAVLAVVTASSTWLVLLTVATVGLWLASTLRHVVERTPHGISPA